VLAVLVGCVGWSAATFYMRNVQTGLDVMAFTGLQMLLGGVMMLVPALLLGEPARWQWSPIGLASLAYMTLFSSCLAYTAYAWLSVHVTPAQVGTYGFVNPAIAVMLGWWILDEVLSPLQIAGTAVIFLAMLLINWPGSAKRGAVTPEPQNPVDR
jgi:drug/metabolite transporter (DMT)-like permease